MNCKSRASETVPTEFHFETKDEPPKIIGTNASSAVSQITRPEKLLITITGDN